MRERLAIINEMRFVFLEGAAAHSGPGGGCGGISVTD